MAIEKQSTCLPGSRVVLGFHLITLIATFLFLGSDGFIAPPGKFINGRTNESNDTLVIRRGRTSIKENSKYLWSAIDDGEKSYQSQSSTDGGTSSHASLLQSAESLSLFFSKFLERELGFNETKAYFEATAFEIRRSPSLEDQAKSLGYNFSTQIKAYIESVERLVESVKLLSDKYNDTLILEKCCEVNPESFEYDAQYNTEVRKDMACWSAGSKSKTNLFVPSLFSQAMVRNLNTLPYLRWQYFLSIPDGVYVEYPANRHNCKVISDGPPAFSPKTHPERKLWLVQKSKEDSRIHRIVFLIQLGRRANPEAIKAMKNIVLMLLRFLDEADEVGILNVDPGDVSSDFLCAQLLSVTPIIKYQILSYLNNIEHRYKTSQEGMSAVESEEDVTGERIGDSISALNAVCRMACSNFSSTSYPPSAATIIHLTSDLYLNQSLNPAINSLCPIFIESYFLRDLGKDEETNYKTQLQRISSKNIFFQVHSMNHMEPESFAIKVALKLNSKKESWSLSDILSQFFPEEMKNSSSGIEFSLPHWNPVSKEPVIVVKKYVFHKGLALGLTAVEIPILHLTQQITYYINENQCNANNYAFLIDTKGRVIAHPGLGRPDTSEEVLSPIQIEQVEVRQGFSSLKQRLLSLSEPSGCQSLRRRTGNDWVTYAWSRVDNYIVVLVAIGDSGGCFPDREESILRKSFLSPKTDVQHHLLLEKEYCCNNQEFSLSKASLYLSPSAFSKPATSLNPHLSVKLSMALMAFLSDNSGLLQNQNKGLKERVKDHVGVLSNILPTWKYQFRNSEWTEYIQRRFAAAGGGSFVLLYPGISIAPGYALHSSAWFRKSVRGNGKLIFSPTRVNSLGTPTSTLTRLLRARGAPNPSAVELPIASLGLTVTLGFFEKILQDTVPECGDRGERRRNGLSIRCVLLDEEGYVVWHSQLATALQTSPLVHFTQIEPLSAIDILQSGPNGTAVPLRKETCHKLSETSATQESLQRFYTLSMPSMGIQKMKLGEMCNHYHILPIPNTNLFLAKIHDNCSSGAAFCPCSTIDNLCLNCLRIELSDCECPCECPREQNFCGARGFSDLPAHVEPCEFPVDPTSLDGTPCGNPTLTCPVWTPCEDILDREKCVGIHDCDWCENPKDHRSSQCKTFDQCYGYLQGRLLSRSQSFSGDGEAPSSSGNSVFIDGKSENESQITIVPILGVLAVFLIFLGVVVYVYRHRALRSSSSQPDVHLLPLQESPMGSVVPQAGSSRSTSDNEGEPAAPVPVLYVRRHRRTQNHPVLPPGSPLGSAYTESDHGYSTMTQNEDSEAGGPLPLLYSDLDPPRPSTRNQVKQLTQHYPLITVPVTVEQV